jgi:phosphoglycolate phosphatase
MIHLDMLVFDLDGTLIASGVDIVASVNYTLSAMDRPALPYDEAIDYIGDGVKMLIERALGNSSPADFGKAIEIFTNHYTEHMLDTTDLYPSVREVLFHFRDKTKVIITNKRAQPTAKIIEAFRIGESFAEIIGADTTPYMKPDPRILLPLMARYGATADRTAIIGDGPNDILLAKEAGVISCALLNGLTRPEVLRALEPDFTCEDLGEIMTHFC